VTRGQSISRAIELKDDASVVERLRQRMPESLEMLDRIACGDVPRNAQSILKGIELQLRYTQPLPKQTIEHQGAVGIAIVDPFAIAPEGQPASAAVIEAEVVEPAALPAPKAKPPVVRRKAKETA
jgi:hypothetical protein